MNVRFSALAALNLPGQDHDSRWSGPVKSGNPIHRAFADCSGQEKPTVDGVKNPECGSEMGRVMRFKPLFGYQVLPARCFSKTASRP